MRIFGCLSFNIMNYIEIDRHRFFIFFTFCVDPMNNKTFDM